MLVLKAYTTMLRYELHPLRYVTNIYVSFVKTPKHSVSLYLVPILGVHTFPLNVSLAFAEIFFCGVAKESILPKWWFLNRALPKAFVAMPWTESATEVDTNTGENEITRDFFWACMSQGWHQFCYTTFNSISDRMSSTLTHLVYQLFLILGIF